MKALLINAWIADALPPPSIGLLVRKPSDEKLMISEIDPFIREYITENNVPEMEFFKTVHYDKV